MLQCEPAGLVTGHAYGDMGEVTACKPPGLGGVIFCAQEAGHVDFSWRSPADRGDGPESNMKHQPIERRLIPKLLARGEHVG